MSAQKNEEKPNEFTLIQFLHKLVTDKDDDSSIDLSSDLSELELVERTILYIKNLQKRQHMRVEISLANILGFKLVAIALMWVGRVKNL